MFTLYIGNQGNTTQGKHHHTHAQAPMTASTTDILVASCIVTSCLLVLRVLKLLHQMTAHSPAHSHHAQGPPMTLNMPSPPHVANSERQPAHSPRSSGENQATVHDLQPGARRPGRTTGTENEVTGPQREDEYTIRILTWGKTQDLLITNKTTLESIKRQIETLTGIAPSQQCITLNGRTLIQDRKSVV